ncbi:MAG: TolC family protein [Bacteroidota bacterium]
MLCSVQVVMAQTLSLDSCISMAEQNYPQIVQYGLLNQSEEYSLANASKGKLPQINIKGQATYQSEVTAVPGGEVPALSKDQYQLYVEIVQPITGLTVVNQQREIIAADAAVSKAQLKSDLYPIKERVSNLFFGILLLKAQLSQSELTRQDIEAGIKRMEGSVKFGTVLKSNLDILKAELISLDQRILDQEASMESYLKMLSLFTGKEIVAKDQLKRPEIFELPTQINRPELNVFSSQLQSLSLQSKLIDKKNLPQFSLFFQSGFGRPALNFLSNDLEPYYIGGLSLSWNIANYYTSKGQKQLLNVNRDLLQSQQETFLFNTRLSMADQDTRISRMRDMIEKDQEIIVLRERIVKTSQGQLENGVLTPSEYKTAVIDADLARQRLQSHEIELLKLKNDLKITSGNQ